MAEEKTENKRDYFQQVTNEIIAAMEKGNIPWQKPWDPEVGGNLCPKAFNGKSGRAYTLDNAVRCLMVMSMKNSNDPRFFTYNQAKEKGWSVRKGSKALCVRQGFYVTKDTDGNDLPEEECHWTNKYINVFHASDICSKAEYVKDENGKAVYEDVLDDNGKPVMVVDLDENQQPKGYEIVYDDDGQLVFDKNGQPLKEPAKKPLRQPKVIYTPIPEYAPKSTSHYTHEETMELAEAILKNSGANIQHISGESAFYERNSDFINIPPKEAFPTLGGYYSVALHELAHWTGHESRLNRDTSGDKMSNKYAREELRAELASVFLSMELGVPVNTTQNAAYIQYWVQNLKEDKKEIFNAMNDAMKITNFIKDLAKDKIREITMTKLGKTEEPEIKVVNEPKQEIVQEMPVVETPIKETTMEETPAVENISDSQNKRQEELDEKTLGQNGIDETETRETEQTPEPINEPMAQEPIEQPEPQPSCLVITVYNPRNGEFGKELEYGTKFKLDDFDRVQTEIALDASSPAEYFAKHNHGVGSLVQVDDELFYMNKDNRFKRIYAANVNGEIFIQQAANPAKFIESTIGKIGQENFDKYKGKFLEVFRTGAAVESPEMAKDDLDLAYSKFVYDNAVKFGLSSNNPIGTKQWKGANEAFMEACIKEFGANDSIIELASKTVKDFCPIKVNDDLLKQSALKSELYQQMSSQENDNVQVAAYGAR